jgi:PAS domain S-box-containing protein
VLGGVERTREAGGREGGATARAPDEPEGRAAFLLALSDALWPLRDAADIGREACRRLRERFGATRVLWFAPDDPGAVRLVAADPADAARAEGPWLLSVDVGGVMASVDVLADIRLDSVQKATSAAAGCRAWANAAPRRDGGARALVSVQFGAPHRLNDGEMALLQDAAERALAATERAHGETALQRAYARMQRVIETDAVGVIFFDGKGVLTDANDVFLAMTGWPRADVVSGRLDWRRLTPSEWQASSDSHLALLAQVGRVGPYERECFRKDGSRAWMLFAGRDLGDGSFVKFVIDVSARKATEAALHESELRMRSLIEGLPQPVWRADPNGRWTWASPQWEAYTGVSDLASHGYGWRDALHPDDREAAADAWVRAPVAGVFQLTCRIRHASTGHYHWFQSRGMPVRAEDGHILEWIGTSTDIDEQMQARAVLARAGEELEQRVAVRTEELQRALEVLHTEAAERQEAEARLRQSEKLKAIGQLTGGIAHDFNNTLQAITSGLDLVRLRLQQARPEDAVVYIDKVERGARRAATLTQRLLAFSRQQTLSPRPVGLGRIARGLAELVARTVGPEVRIELKLADDRWLVLCDPNEMESALLNLCVNARDAMPAGGWLTIATEEMQLTEADIAGHEDLKPGRYVCLAVSDTGVGMASDVAARAFEPFFTTKPLGEGTGLGLSQIYGFVRQSGGFVQIETALGEGTTVRLYLPFHALANEGIAKTVSDAGPTLLLVEDEQDVRELTAEFLRERGYRVLEAESGPAALRLMQAGVRIDLLISDLGLPGGMTGRQLVDVARQRYPGVPAILITGIAGAVPAEGEDIIGKPFAAASLAEMVDSKLR